MGYTSVLSFVTRETRKMKKHDPTSNVTGGGIILTLISMLVHSRGLLGSGSRIKFNMIK